MDAGVRSQELPRRFADMLAGIVAGPKSEAYLQLVWRSFEEIVDIEGHPATLPIAEADPDAFILEWMPRFKKKAVVLGAGRSALEEVLRESGGQLAAAYSYKGRSYAGILPDGMANLGYLEETDQQLVAEREGLKDWPVGLGSYLTSREVLIMPHDVQVVEQHIPIPDLVSRYPGTVLV